MILNENTIFTQPTILGTTQKEVVTNNAILMQMIITPATTTTTFDVKITDLDSNILWNEDNYTGVCNELLSLPTYGNLYFIVENASADENFKFNLTFRRS